VIDLLAAIFVPYNYGKKDMLTSFNHRRKMKAESRQTPQKLPVRLKFVCWLFYSTSTYEQSSYTTILINFILPNVLSYRKIFALLDFLHRLKRILFQRCLKVKIFFKTIQSEKSSAKSSCMIRYSPVTQFALSPKMKPSKYGDTIIT